MGTRLAAVWLGLSLVLAGFSAEAAAATKRDITVSLVAPEPGSTNSGTVEVRATTTGPVLGVRFEWSTDDGETWMPIGTDAVGADGWSALWETRPYSGPARVRAVATDGTTERADGHEISVLNTVLTVRVRAHPNVFSPNGDGRKDVSQIRVSSTVPARFTVRLFDAQGRLRREWLVRAAPSQPARIRWDGRDDSGRIVGHGRYSIRARGEDLAGRVARDRGEVFVDLRNPVVRWRHIRPEPAHGGERVRFRFRAEDRSRRLLVRLEIRDRLGPIRTYTVDRTRGRMQVVTRSRYQNGRKFVPGIYVARLFVRDDAGNVTTKTRTWRVYRNVGSRVWTRVDGAGRRVALTFDDCTYPGPWKQMLRTLKRFGAKATFFCPGQRVYGYPALARRTVRAGHTPGSHGWDHSILSGRSLSYSENRLRRDREAWWDVARSTSVPYFRPPYGAYDRNTLAAAAKTSHSRVVNWDVDPLDWASSSPSYISRYVVNHARPGSIVVLHVKQPTANALPDMLRGLRRRDLKPVSLDQLFRAAGHR